MQLIFRKATPISRRRQACSKCQCDKNDKSKCLCQPVGGSCGDSQWSKCACERNGFSKECYKANAQTCYSGLMWRNVKAECLN